VKILIDNKIFCCIQISHVVCILISKINIAVNNINIPKNILLKITFQNLEMPSKRLFKTLKTCFRHACYLRNYCVEQQWQGFFCRNSSFIDRTTLWATLSQRRFSACNQATFRVARYAIYVYQGSVSVQQSLFDLPLYSLFGVTCHGNRETLNRLILVLLFT